jgi:hypothetical protein
MVNSTGGVSAGSLLNNTVLTKKPNESMDSFTQELVSALDSYLSKSGNGSQLEISIQSGQGQGGAGQYTITVSQEPAAPAASVSSGESLMDAHNAVAPAANTPAAAPAPALTPVKPFVDKSAMTPTDAYWAEQPPAVQALRNIPDDQRAAAAQDLANQGYTIDVPIMVWGWDPLVTMTQRAADGFTWVPSALQPAVPVAPGDSFPNLPSYDPNTPPPGSIPVSTAFAQGTNMQDPWMHAITTSAS